MEHHPPSTPFMQPQRWEATPTRGAEDGGREETKEARRLEKRASRKATMANERRELGKGQRQLAEWPSPSGGARRPD